MKNIIKASGTGDALDEQSLEELAALERVHRRLVNKRNHLEAEELGLKNLLADRMAELEAMTAEMQADLEVWEDVKEMVSNWNYLAAHDELTGLWNRGAILDILRRELVRSEREGLLVGVLIAELDDFRYAIDTCGRLAGDEVIRETARRIYKSVRSDHAVGRFGEDYYLIVLAGCENAPDVLKQAERIHLSVTGNPVATVGGMIPARLSIGAAVGAGLAVEESLIKAADAALYRAKRAGGNRVELAASATSGNQRPHP